AGTDFGVPYVVPGFSLHELALFVQAGFTPLEALQTATINPAKFLDQADSLGTVEKGKLADLVLLEANPLEDIHNTQKINAVVVNGRLIPKSELQAMLASVEAEANKK
ncbi:MAG TPA: amidohydrolase family protein, partial [Blastocatellia bacterium]|nr:amidohydrolase family protein [Blastocatellia bacterium]